MVSLRVVLVLGLGTAVFAGAEPAFEVASVKPSRSGQNGVAGACHEIDTVSPFGPRTAVVPLGRCFITSARLSHLISMAWGIEAMDMIRSGPDWIARGDERFDVEAKAEDPTKTTEQQLHTMLQNLLIERFKLKFHREAVEMAGFALTIDAKGAKLERSTSQEASLAFANGQPKAIRGPVSMRARRYSMTMLNRFLSVAGEMGPGTDKTGLDGFYDFTLSWDNDAGPTLGTALREQLGLRMTPQKVQISNFVIDSAQRPSEN
jgi:uncharacterized protein (TIGR03435 family)